MTNEKELWFADQQQLTALMTVLDEIVRKPAPLMESFELSSRNILRRLQSQIDSKNVLDDSVLVDDLNEARDEIKYLVNYCKHLIKLVDQLKADQ